MTSVDLRSEQRPLPGPDWIRATLDQRPPVAIRHPLGFVCLRLEGDEENLCVHVWTGCLDRAVPTTSPIHCHNWDLRSRVLYGQVRNQLVDVIDGAETPTHRVFEIRSEGWRDIITPTDRLVRWRLAATASHGAGETYELPAGSFHMTVVPEGQEAATVVRSRRRQGLVDRSLGKLDMGSHSVSRQRYASDEAAHAVQSVVRRLATYDKPRGATP